MTLLPGTNRVLVVGGANQSGTVLPSAQICLADMSSCSATGSLSLQRYFHTATVVGTKIFIAGGWTAAGLSVATSSVEVCDVGAGSNPSCVFTTAPTMVNAHAQHAAVMTGLKILVVGGGGSTSAEVLDLNAVTPAWAGTTNAPLATHGAGVSATLLADNATVLVVGGSANTSVRADLYSFTTGNFTASTATLASDVSNHTATLMPGASNKVLVAGGHTSSGTSLNTWLYDSTAIPTTNAFTAGPNLATAREFFTATLLGTNEVLLAGGLTGTTPLNTSERVTADGSSISPSGNLTAKRTQHAALRLFSSGNVAITGGSTTTTAEIYTP